MTTNDPRASTGTGISPDPAAWLSVGTIEHCSWDIVCCMYCTYLPTLYTPPASQLLPTLPPPLQVTHLHPLFSKRIFFLLFSFVIFPTHASKPAPLSFPEAGSQFHQPTFRDNRHFTQSVLRFTPCGNSISVLPNYRMAKIRQAMFKGPTYIQVLM